MSRHASHSVATFMVTAPLDSHIHHRQTDST